MKTYDPEFDELFDRLFPMVARTVFRILDDASEAEDVTAEAFARALSRWNRVSRLDWREAWITRVAINLAIDRRRRSSPTMRNPEAHTDATDQVLDRELLVAAMGRLSARQRAVVGLRYLAELPTAEIADRMGLTEGTVRVHLSRALRRLRIDLEALT